MPAATRSQTTVEDKGVSTSKSTSKPTTKRKASNKAEEAAKKQKKSPPSDTKNDEDSILINRAPVLELWATCVAQFLHPSLSWSTCLSVGGGISALAAISKGRSIGKMHKPDPGKQQEKREKRREEQAGLEEVDVMGFNLRIKDGDALVGDKPKKGNEEALKKKYGEEAYSKAKDTFEQALKSWKGKEEELGSQAFHMYEDFRPSVAPGQKGWGRKGQLSLETIKSAIENG